MTEDPASGRRAWRTGQEWARLSDRIAAADSGPAGPSHWAPPRWVAVAAVILVVATAMLARYAHEAGSRGESRVFTTAAGQRLVVRLSDGSAATLGPATTLRFNESSARRDITLDGLAFFRVVHDSRRPFVVSAHDARATDVGTEFVVRAYATDSSVQVAVTNGIVALSGGAGSTAQVTLRAGDVGTVRGDSAPRTVHSALAASYAAWIDGRLSFDNAPLSEVTAELSRWFDVDIQIEDRTVAQRRVTAIYSDARLAGVLDALAATMNLRYTQTGRAVTLRAAGRSE